MSNLEIWNKHAQPPTEALKKIGGGRLSGMTDISPQWRLMALTDIFGACGIGWSSQIVEHFERKDEKGQVAVFVRVHLKVKVDGEWSDPIEGTGGSMLIAQEKSGLYFSDEAYKMAETDALSVCCKKLGIAANIYLNFNGSKYQKNDSAKPEEIKPDDRFEPIPQKKPLKRGDVLWNKGILTMSSKGVAFDKLNWDQVVDYFDLDLEAFKNDVKEAMNVQD